MGASLPEAMRSSAGRFTALTLAAGFLLGAAPLRAEFAFLSQNGTITTYTIGSNGALSGTRGKPWVTCFPSSGSRFSEKTLSMESHIWYVTRLTPMETKLMRSSPQIRSNSATPTGLIEPKGSRFTLESARFVLSLAFSDEAERRVHDLLLKNQEGRISPAEKEDLEHLVKANTHLSTLQSKARLFLNHVR